MSVLYPPSSPYGREKQPPSIKHHSGKNKFFHVQFGCIWMVSQTFYPGTWPHNIQLPMMTKLCTSFTYLILGKEIDIQAGKLHSKEPPVLRNYQLRLKYLFCLESRFFFQYVYDVSCESEFTLNLLLCYTKKLKASPYVNLVTSIKNNFLFMLSALSTG